jgi:hypothetical protein
MAEKIKIFQDVIDTYNELLGLLDDTDTEKKKLYNDVISTYTELIDLESDDLPKAPIVVAPAPAPSSAAQSVAKSADEKKLEKIKALLQANEAIIKECGFKIEP